VRSQIAWNNFDPNSTWQASAIFAPQNRAKVETAFREEIARALKDGFTPQELDEGRSGLLNFRRLSRAQDDVLASQLAGNLYVGRDFAVSARVDAALAALTLEQVNGALRKYLKPEQIDAVFAGDFKR
jgi:zinc protease